MRKVLIRSGISEEMLRINGLQEKWRVMALELDRLKKALGALERSLRVAGEQSAGDADLVETLRAGVVQNF